MKILYLSSVSMPSEKASPLAILRQCEGFAKNGHEVVLHVPKRTRGKNNIESFYNLTLNFTIKEFPSIKLFFIGKPGLFLLYCYETIHVLWHLLGNWGSYDVIYSRDQYRLFPCMTLGLAKRCFAELHTVHSNMITRYVARHAKKVIVISRGLKDFYQEVGQRTDIQVEPSGVYSEQFSGLKDTGLTKRQLGLPADRLIYGYVGKMKTIGMSKGVEEIIEAFSIAYQKKQKLFLYLVGVNTEEESGFQDLVAKYKIPTSAYQLAPLDQSKFATYLHASDLLMMNYPNQEHYAKYMSPIKLFAYLAVCKPIISSDLPTIREIEGMESVLYVTPDSVTEYAEKMVEAAASIVSLTATATANKVLANKFAWDVRAERILC